MSAGKRRLLLMAISLPLWLVVLFLGGELWARNFYSFGNIYNYSKPLIEARRIADAQTYESTAALAPRPAQDLVACFPQLELLEDADAERVAALAAQWQGIILETGVDGGVHHVSMPSPHEDLKALAEVALTAENVDSLVDEQQAVFLRQTLGEAVFVRRLAGIVMSYTMNRGSMMEFCRDFPGHPSMGVLCYIYPYLNTNNRGSDAAVVLIPGRFSVCVFKYRPDFYLRDFYAEFPGSEFWTNRLGFRDEEVVLPKPAGVYRIVCVGGSTTVGGPRNDLTYPNLIEAKLREEFGTDKVEVINGGVDGMGLGGIVSRLDDFLATKPDLVLLYKFVNDAPNILEATIRGFGEQHPIRAGIAEFLSRSRLMEQHGSGLTGLFLPGSASYEATAREAVMGSLETLRARAAAHGAELAIASFDVAELDTLPLLERAWFRSQLVFQLPYGAGFDAYATALHAFNQLCRDYCEKNGLLYIPVEEEMSGGMSHFTDIAHLNLHGLDEKAAICARYLEEKVKAGLQH